MNRVTVGVWVVVMALVVLSISICVAADGVVITGTVLSGGRLEGDNGTTYVIAVKDMGNELRMKQNSRVEVKATILDNKGDRPTIDVIEYTLK